METFNFHSMIERSDCSEKIRSSSVFYFDKFVIRKKKIFFHEWLLLTYNRQWYFPIKQIYKFEILINFGAQIRTQQP